MREIEELGQAVRRGDEAKCRALLVAMNFASEDLVSSLCMASGSGDLRICQLLLAHGAVASVGEEHPFADQVTPLDRAVEGRHIEVIRLLLQHGAMSGHSLSGALASAARRGDLEISRLLVEHGAEGAGRLQLRPCPETSSCVAC